jgi:hypothetical protein
MNTDTVPPFSMPSPLLRSDSSRRSDLGLFIGLSTIVMLVLIGSGLAAFFFLFPNRSLPSSAANSVVGQAFFSSSGQWNDNSSQGDNDTLQIELSNVPAPATGKSYYAWLLSDKSQNPMVAIPLGALSFDQGKVHFSYSNPQHTNLIATTSRLLITEENSQSSPAQPSKVWRYYAELPQASSTNGTSRSTALSSIRALLYEEPHLYQLGIRNGLNIQLLRNTGKLLEWIYSARDTTESLGNHDTGFIHRQLVRALDYLDGKYAVQVDAPPGTLLLADPLVPLLNVTPNQGTISYLSLIHEQLTNLMVAPGVTPETRALAKQLDQTIMNYVQPGFMKLRLLAKQLVSLPEAQLLSPSAQLGLDQMVLLANAVFVGQLDPATNQVQAGVVQTFYNIQRLATYEIEPYQSH